MLVVEAVAAIQVLLLLAELEVAELVVLQELLILAVEVAVLLQVEELLAEMVVLGSLLFLYQLQTTLELQQVHQLLLQ
jgi:hypothetical protein